MEKTELAAALRAAAPRLTQRFGHRIGTGSQIPTVARELVESIIDDLASRSTSATAPASSLGVLRAHQRRSSASLVEDVLCLRPLLWGHIASLPGCRDDLALLLLEQDRLTEILDGVLAAAVAAYVEESTRVLSCQATRDPLTGLANRSAFDDALARAVTGAARQAVPALLLLDLDSFKALNDTLGHLAGDEALQRVGHALAEAVRGGDVAARLGGDEFAVVLADATTIQAERVAARILRAIDNDRFLRGLAPPVRVSIGIAVGDRAVSSRDLVAAADAALYRAKRAGGGRATVAEDGDRPEEAARQASR